jgi:fructokinase
MTDVVTLGELLIDMVATRQNVTLFDAPAFEPKAGGAPANVAVGVRRLGKSAAFIGKVGRDDFGRGLRQTLEAEGVDTRNLIEDASLLTTLAFVSLSDRGDPAFAFFQGAHTNLTPADLDADLIRGARVFHFGSVSLVNEPARSATLEALRIAKAASVICSYDINWRPALWPSRNPSIAKGPLAQVDIIKMNEGELELVTGEADVRTGLLKLDVPAPLIVITLGEKGCMYRFEGQLYTQSVPPVTQVVDATGAGDSFMAAILADFRLPLDAAYLTRLTRRACQAGAITTTRRGAIPSLPHTAELDPL